MTIWAKMDGGFELPGLKVNGTPTSTFCAREQVINMCSCSYYPFCPWDEDEPDLYNLNDGEPINP